MGRWRILQSFLVGAAILVFAQNHSVWAKGPDLDDYPNLYKVLDDTNKTPGKRPNKSPSKRQIYRIGIKKDRPRPSQRVVGMEEVRERSEKIDGMKNREVREYLEDHIAKIVIGPGRVPWLINGHHLCRAMWELDFDEVLVKVQDDWSDLTDAEFWRRMKKSSFVWDEDGNGRSISIPDGLPKSISGLKNDEFRSFAWRIKKLDGFEATEIPFAEFQWARFYRHFFSRSEVMDPSSKVLIEAVRLAHSHYAKDLPG